MFRMNEWLGIGKLKRKQQGPILMIYDTTNTEQQSAVVNNLQVFHSTSTMSQQSLKTSGHSL